MAAERLHALDRRGRVTAIPFQAPGAPERYGLSREQCEQAAWTVDGAGVRRRGAGAIYSALASALSQPWLVALYERLRPFRRVSDRLYDWVASHRSRFPGVTPTCRRHPEACGGPAGPACGAPPLEKR